MAILTPQKRPFAPWLKGHAAFSSTAKKRGGADLLLTPLIDMFVILVVFLIMNFSGTPEWDNLSKDLPRARARQALERAPIIQISQETVAIEGFSLGDTASLSEGPDLRIPGLTDKLEDVRKVDELLHPGVAFAGQVIINAHRDVDFRVIRKVMMACAEAGYTAINYAVLTTGGRGG